MEEMKERQTVMGGLVLRSKERTRGGPEAVKKQTHQTVMDDK